jgi:RND family efflux transporter MFP subunit
LVTAAVGTLQQTVTTTGTIEPAQKSDLTFTVSGTVTGVAATVGKKVAKGAVLATIDSTTLQTAVTTATASVTAAQQQLASVAGSSTTQVAAAQAQLAAANTSLAQANDDLAAASLTAPFAGVVASVGMAVGDTVGSSGSNPNAASSSSTTTKAITLISTDAWVVNATVGSSDLSQLKKGLQAQITPSGSTTMVFGTIASLGIVATSTSGGSATFPVVINVTGSPTGLYAGGTADVALIVKQLNNVLTIPTQAVRSVNGATVVYQRVGGKRVTTPVIVGASYGPTTEITSGLKAGDQVEISFNRPGGTVRRNGTTGGGGGGGGGPQVQQNFGQPGGGNVKVGG